MHDFVLFGDPAVAGQTVFGRVRRDAIALAFEVGDEQADGMGRFTIDVNPADGIGGPENILDLFFDRVLTDHFPSRNRDGQAGEGGDRGLVLGATIEKERPDGLKAEKRRDEKDGGGGKGVQRDSVLAKRLKRPWVATMRVKAKTKMTQPSRL